MEPVHPPVETPPDPESTLRPEVVAVDADLATQWLRRNTNNRKVREQKVAQYHAEMIEGRWKFNGEAIKFDSMGNLLDGQHRLEALARTAGTGLAFSMLVVVGLGSDTQVTMDQGVKRTPADQLELRGIGSATTAQLIAGTIRVLERWLDGNVFGDQTRVSALSAPRVVEWAERNPRHVEIITVYASRGITRIKARPSVTSAVAVRLHHIDPDDCAEFFDRVLSGAGLALDSPILALRERLDRIRTNKIKTSDREFLALFVLTWNAFRRGRPLTKLQLPKGGLTRANFPEPV
ncbi:hypothetical protein [Nocardia fluminea]|uniref:Uncharacterized protein n=1 Tax=Nocardia fluminea TaxID=134984 RepID=A0A2N3V4Y7_9NOCA|nr:hypothetical protein [Nocardia fluminea]PKV76690.1 hypothetical protein ATK86_7090 [Nocardia fluminea]